MSIKSKDFSKHLARNVPRHFNYCVERERVLIAEIGNRSPRRVYFKRMLSNLSDEPLDEETLLRLDQELAEIELRFLVLTKTIDQSVPPTPIKKALASLANRVEATERMLRDDDRDALVRSELGLEEAAILPATRDAFDNANTLAERAAIARQMLLTFAEDLEEISTFFDYKANLSVKGASTRFSIIYGVNALADMFERENKLGRVAAINMSFNSGDEAEYLRYTGAFRWFMTEFLRKVDDSLVFAESDNAFADRLRKLSRNRKKDPKLFKLLHGRVTVEDTLEFMRRAEAIK